MTFRIVAWCMAQMPAVGVAASIGVGAPLMPGVPAATVPPYDPSALIGAQGFQAGLYDPTYGRPPAYYPPAVVPDAAGISVMYASLHPRLPRSWHPCRSPSPLRLLVISGAVLPTLRRDKTKMGMA